MNIQLDAGDEGKRLVTPDGAFLGWVRQVRDGTVHVRPKEGLVVGCGSWISGTWNEEGSFVLDCSHVRKTTDTEVVLSEPPQLPIA